MAIRNMQTLNLYLAPMLQALDQFFDRFESTNEHQIIKHLQAKKISPFDVLSLANTKDLFSAHFLCMHALYHLKKQYQQAQKFTLIIESVRVERITLSKTESSDDELKIALKANDALASYYLDPKHYFDTQEDEINAMLKSFWQRYMAQDDKQEALDTLNLPMNADAKMVKAQYLQLAQKHHPDKGGCADMFKKISQAKTLLDKALGG